MKSQCAAALVAAGLLLASTADAADYELPASCNSVSQGAATSTDTTRSFGPQPGVSAADNASATAILRVDSNGASTVTGNAPGLELQSLAGQDKEAVFTYDPGATYSIRLRIPWGQIGNGDVCIYGITIDTPAGMITEARPTFAGVAPDGVTVRARVGGVDICSATAVSGGWSCAPSFDLTEGTHAISATANVRGTTLSMQRDIEVEINSCPAGEIECGVEEFCVNPLNDPNNCGDCGVRINDGTDCTIDSCIDGVVTHEDALSEPCGANSFCNPNGGFCVCREGFGGPNCEALQGFDGCGDGDSDGGEDCDDGNADDGDGCSVACTTEAGWECGDSFPSQCSTLCGDGLLRGDEDCDDGNTESGDGCSDCAVDNNFSCDDAEPSVCTDAQGPECGDAVCDTSEDEDSCPDDCEPVAGACGDGMIAENELCDDNNTDDGDGCSAACAVEPDFACEGEPSVCDAIDDPVENEEVGPADDAGPPMDAGDDTQTDVAETGGDTGSGDTIDDDAGSGDTTTDDAGSGDTGQGNTGDLAEPPPPVEDRAMSPASTFNCVTVRDGHRGASLFGLAVLFVVARTRRLR